jgi:hypothetical protein
MRKTLTLILAVALFGILAAVVVAQVGGDPAPSSSSATTETTESAPDVTTPDVTTPDVTTPQGTTTTEDNPERVGTEASPSGDISGPCDEAEHAGDPRCTGAVAGKDNSGPGSGNSGHSDADDESSGSSGSGHSGGGDDSDDDSSGHGGDGDSSGHGGDDD